jgi:hypothetical protein
VNVNFVCQLDWAAETEISGKSIISECFCGMFPERLASESDWVEIYAHQYDEVSSILFGVRI